MSGTLGEPSFASYLIWFVFDNSETGRPAGFVPEALWDTAAFSVVAALTFVAFVVIDFSVFMVRRYGFKALGAGELGIAHGIGTVVVIFFGAVGAMIVGFAAAILDLLQLNAQAGLVTGITWQIVYANMLARARGQAREQPGEPVPVEQAAVQDDIEQTATTEESED